MKRPDISGTEIRMILSYLKHKNTEFKEYNSRSLDYGDSTVVPSIELERRICAKFPLVPVIDFELQKLDIAVEKLLTVPDNLITPKENIDKMMNFDLFQPKTIAEVVWILYHQDQSNANCKY